MKVMDRICCGVVFSLIFFVTTCLIAEENISIRTFRGESIEPFLEDITGLCITIYREYPYSYEGTKDEYFPFIEYYAHSDKGIASLVFVNNRPVGVAIGMPMSEMREKYKDPFTNARSHESLEEIFYLGEILPLKDYRGKGFGKDMYLEFEQEVKKNKFCKKICFCKIDESNQTNPKPENYKPLDGFWEKNGFNKCDDITTIVNWQNIGDLNESPHQLVYWLKSFSKN